MDITSRVNAHLNANIALATYMRDHSVAIWQQHLEKDYIGSGTCVEIDGRFFVVTAAHNFEDIPRGGRVSFVSGFGSSTDPLKEIGHNYGKFGAKGTLDVAWIEIERQSANERSLQGIPLRLVEPFQTPEVKGEQRYYEVTGFPFELGEKERIGRSMRLLIYNSRPVKSESENLMLDYVEAAYSQREDVALGLKELPHPRGVSGGGIWYFPHVTQSEVWSPVRCRLVGTVINFWSGKREIEGLRTYHWLRLLLADRPELREYIEPVLKQT